MVSIDANVQNKPAAVAPKENHHPLLLRFWNWAEEKTVDAAKICGGAEKMLLKTETQQTFVNGLLGFITLHYTPLKRVCIAHTIVRVAHRYGQLYSHCSLIYFWVPSSCFFA